MIPSLRRRLLFYLLGSTIAAWSIAGVSSYFESLAQMEEVFDAQLIQSAKGLLSVSRHELHEQLASEDRATPILPDVSSSQVHRYEQVVAFQIWVGKEHLAVRSQTAPDFPLVDAYGVFKNKEIAGASWRTYGLYDAQADVAVHVAERFDVRAELARAISLRLISGLAVGLPTLGILIWVSTGRGLQPLRRLAFEMSSRSPQRLEPINATHAPSEVSPLVNALNSLLRRLDSALENERRFTADAAHELRTPLAALKTHAQLALRTEDKTARSLAIARLIRGVDRTSHLIEQLLTLARLDPQAQQRITLKLNPVDLCPLAQQTLADLAPIAVTKRIELSLSEPCQGTVMGDATMLTVLIRNLAENALNYTPTGGTVEVEIRPSEKEVTLLVGDSGPGISPEDLPHVFNRFYRGLGNSQTGSGLGLSIVQRIVDIHEAHIELSRSNLGGLLVIVALPRSLSEGNQNRGKPPSVAVSMTSKTQ